MIEKHLYTPWIPLSRNAINALANDVNKVQCYICEIAARVHNTEKAFILTTTKTYTYCTYWTQVFLFPFSFQFFLSAMFIFMRLWKNCVMITCKTDRNCQSNLCDTLSDLIYCTRWVSKSNPVAILLIYWHTGTLHKVLESICTT